MFTTGGVRKGVVVLGVAAVAALAGVGGAEAQVSGRVVFADGPIGVSIVSLRQLDLYLSRIEHEYDFYRRMHPRDAYIHHGWSPRELSAYVRWLKDERRFLRDERRRLERGLRGWERDGRGRGR